MRKKRLMTTGLFIVLFFSVQTAFGQYVFDYIGGQITNSVSGVGVSNVNVRILPVGCGSYPGDTVQTNTFGYWSAYVPFDCSLVVVPQHRKYTFDPASRAVNYGAYEPLNFLAIEN